MIVKINSHAAIMLHKFACIQRARTRTEAFKREPEPTKDPALEQEKAPAFYNSSFVGPAFIPGLGRVYSL